MDTSLPDWQLEPAANSHSALSGLYRTARDLDSGVVTTSATFDRVLTSTHIMPARRGQRGGDWCEVFSVAPDLLAVSIGDVGGHGEAAYRKMLPLRQLLRKEAFFHRDPATILARANAVLCAYQPGVFATAIFGFIRATERSLRFANAGHPPPLIAGAVPPHFARYENADFPLGVDSTLAPLTGP